MATLRYALSWNKKDCRVPALHGSQTDSNKRERSSCIHSQIVFIAMLATAARFNGMPVSPHASI